MGSDRLPYLFLVYSEICKTQFTSQQCFRAPPTGWIHFCPGLRPILDDQKSPANPTCHAVLLQAAKMDSERSVPGKRYNLFLLCVKGVCSSVAPQGLNQGCLDLGSDALFFS